MIPARTISRMRTRVRRRLTSRAVILRATEVETETGTRIDYLPTGPAVAAGVRDPTIGAETLLADRIQASTVLTVLLPIRDDLGGRPDVRAQDRIQVTTTDPVGGGTFSALVTVEGVQGAFSDWPLVQRVVGQVMG